MSSTQMISTTKLAKELKISTRRLFSLLKDYEWIAREGEQWSLLANGEKQGGEYQEGDFGRYIVWPQTLFSHPLLQAAADEAQITASRIGEHFGHPARFVNRVLRELGWLRHTEQGWLLTDFGQALGAQQLQSDQGMHYASWPKTLLSEPALIASFNSLNVREQHSVEHERDLFDAPPALSHPPALNHSGDNAFMSLDGHILKTTAATEVCQWLYLLDLTHACQRSLGGHEQFVCDFYLPKYGVYIDIWNSTDRAQALSQHLAKQQWCNEQQLTLIELHEDDITKLDQVLSFRLAELGIHVY